MAANVRSLFILAKLVVPHMAAGGGGSIVNISSGWTGWTSPEEIWSRVVDRALGRFE